VGAHAEEDVTSRFLPAGLAVAALLAALSRWLVQGSGNLYTVLEKRFYVPDADLGWRVSAAHPAWIGLDTCAGVAALAMLTVIGGYVIGRREARRGVRSPLLRATAWTLGAVAMIVPLAAFASGSRPSGAVEAFPGDAGQPLPENALTGRLDAPAGRYEVVPHAGTSITARLSAGGETFDARFASHLDGFWQGDPHDLAAPTTATITVATAAIDTGVGSRSKHARTRYLQADRHPRIGVTVDRLVAAEAVATGGVRFLAHGTLSLMGRTHPIVITGVLKRADDAALERLKLSGTILLVQASFSITIAETALAPRAGSFQADVIPISVSLVLRHAGG
jgi:polyisoprenoid-binding protein YceI